MQIITLTIAVLALVIGISVTVHVHLTISHLPTHVSENKRINKIETWIRSRCAKDSVGDACLHFQSATAPETTRLFRLLGEP